MLCARRPTDEELKDIPRFVWYLNYLTHQWTEKTMEKMRAMLFIKTAATSIKSHYCCISSPFKSADVVVARRSLLALCIAAMLHENKKRMPTWEEWEQIKVGKIISNFNIIGSHHSSAVQLACNSNFLLTSLNFCARSVRAIRRIIQLHFACCVN